jgi:hypothetical protein
MVVDSSYRLVAEADIPEGSWSGPRTASEGAHFESRKTPSRRLDEKGFHFPSSFRDPTEAARAGKNE